MNETHGRFKKYLSRIRYLQATSYLLRWDQETHMPPGGIEHRAEQLALIDGLVHEHFSSDELRRMLETLAPYASELDPDSTDALAIRYAVRECDKSARVPGELATEIVRAGSMASDAWRVARSTSNFRHFEPHLRRAVELAREKAALLTTTDNPYDGLLDYYEPDANWDIVNGVFAALKPRLVELVEAIAANQHAVDGSLIARNVPQEKQLAASRQILETIGYDFERGRIDLTSHPFAWGTGLGDSRVTTRVIADNPMDCILACIHEAGHAMHLQNMDADVAETPMAYFDSGSILESQSRFFENMIGRSRAFWHHQYPALQAALAPAFDDLSLDGFYGAINESKPSLIRVEADEVTYGLHIMLRLEIENELINGRIEVADLPDEWRARMASHLWLVPSDDADGVLQDIHWSWGMFGYYPGYLLGSIYAAQLWDTAQRDIPDIVDKVGNGDIAPIRSWTTDKVMRHGGKYTFFELTDRTVDGFSSEPYVRYLTEKFSAIYGL